MLAIDPLTGLVLAFIIGLAVGSFLNVVIIRTQQERSPWRGRSKCMSCGKELHWYELVPLISFVWLRGRCRSCRQHLSWQYPLVEGLTGALFMLVAWRFGDTWWTPLGWLVAAAMMLVVVYDARWLMLPDEFTIVLAVTGALFALTGSVPLVDLLIGLIGGAAFFAAQYFLSRGRWVGSGDILLGAALGCLLGWRMLALGLFLAYMIGSIAAVIMILTAKQKLGGKIPFGPYLVAGGLLAWLWGEQIVNWYFNHALFR